MKSKQFARRVQSYGPGGYHCPCCGPAPGARHFERRQQRKIFNRVLDRIELDEQYEESSALLDDESWERHHYYHGIDGSAPHDDWIEYQSKAQVVE